MSWDLLWTYESAHVFYFVWNDLFTSSCCKFCPTTRSSSSKSRIFFSPNVHLKSQRQAMSCHWCHVYVKCHKIYLSICVITNHKSYLSLLLSSSPSIVASFLAMSSYFLSDSAIVNLSSFNWPSSLSPEKIGITRLLSFRENGKLTWRCYVEIFHEIHLVLHWRCSSFLASDALWLPCRL